MGSISVRATITYPKFTSFSGSWHSNTVKSWYKACGIAYERELDAS